MLFGVYVRACALRVRCVCVAHAEGMLRRLYRMIYLPVIQRPAPVWRKPVTETLGDRAEYHGISLFGARSYLVQLKKKKERKKKKKRRGERRGERGRGCILRLKIRFQNLKACLLQCTDDHIRGLQIG